MNDPRRATAGGTTRTPVALMAWASRLPNLVGTLSKKFSEPDAMSSLSARRNDSNTAFLIHWCTVHCPMASRVATRRRPASSSAMTWPTASWISLVATVGDRLARSSQARSMMVCSCAVMCENSEKKQSQKHSICHAGWVLLAHHRPDLQKATRRSAPSTQRSVSATSAMRTRPWPGFMPFTALAK